MHGHERHTVAQTHTHTGTWLSYSEPDARLSASVYPKSREMCWFMECGDISASQTQCPQQQPQQTEQGEQQFFFYPQPQPEQHFFFHDQQQEPGQHTVRVVAVSTPHTRAAQAEAEAAAERLRIFQLRASAAGAVADCADCVREQIRS